MVIDSKIFGSYDPHDFKGVKISSGGPKDHPKITVDRNRFLAHYVLGEKVIHLGCCDHYSIIKEKRENNIWLHDILVKNSKACCGIDIDKEAVAYLQNELFVPDIYYCDATKEIPDYIKSNGPWDTIIAGEILEHIDNPVLFLRGIKTTWKTCADEIVITVPNAFSYVNFRNTTKNVEWNNPDHRYWFTPFTLGKICFESGLTPVEFFFVNKGNPESRRFFDHVRFLAGRYPMLRSTLIMVCKF
jgi:hypothetical protein